ncbi:MAG: hypothetical protein AAGJ81_08145 [Verrucomicrobiota bacterium]
MAENENKKDKYAPHTPKNELRGVQRAKVQATRLKKLSRRIPAIALLLRERDALLAAAEEAGLDTKAILAAVAAPKLPPSRRPIAKEPETETDPGEGKDPATGGNSGGGKPPEGGENSEGGDVPTNPEPPQSPTPPEGGKKPPAPPKKGK